MNATATVSSPKKQKKPGKKADREWRPINICPIELPGPESPIAVRPKLPEEVQRLLLAHVPQLRTLDDLAQWTEGDLYRLTKSGWTLIQVEELWNALADFAANHPHLAGTLIKAFRLDDRQPPTDTKPAEVVAGAKPATADVEHIREELEEKKEAFNRILTATNEAEEKLLEWQEALGELNAAKEKEKRLREQKDAANERVLRVIKAETEELPLLAQHQDGKLSLVRKVPAEAKPSGNTQAWRELDVTALADDALKTRISEKQAEKLQAAGLEKLGQLRDKCQSDFWWKDVDGIGKETAAKIGDALNEYLETGGWHQAAADEAGATEPPAEIDLQQLLKENALSVACDVCGVHADQKCKNKSGHELVNGFHRIRFHTAMHKRELEEKAADGDRAEFQYLPTEELVELLEDVDVKVPSKIVSEWGDYQKKVAQKWAQADQAAQAGEIKNEDVPDMPDFLEQYAVTDAPEDGE